MDVPSIDLAPPAVADFDFPVPAGFAVSDDEVISEAVWHLPDTKMVVFKGLGVALPRAAIVDDDVTPASLLDRCLVDFGAD